MDGTVGGTFKIELALNHYKSSVQRLVEVVLSIPDKHAELPLSSSANSKVDIENDSVHEKTVEESYQGQTID